MKVLISGICGHMGRELCSLIRSGKGDIELSCGVDCVGAEKGGSDASVKVFGAFDDVDIPFDVIIDFSHHSATQNLLRFATDRKKGLVIATTGQTDEEKALIYSASSTLPVFFASNYSIGVATLIKMAKTAVRAMPEADIEIVEAHHNCKLDAPSGTALSIFEAVKSVRNDSVMKCGRSGQCKRTENEVGIHSLRMANVAGRHEIHITTDSEELVIKHEAFSRGVFAKGALDAALFLKDKPSGLYGMEDLLGDK